MDLEFTRGDTQYIKFKLKDVNGDNINLTNEDKLYFTVKQSSNSKKVLLQKKYPETINQSDGYFYFVIESEDTSSLSYGTYEYDIELKSGTYVKTLGAGTITLTEEITHKEDE